MLQNICLCIIVILSTEKLRKSVIFLLFFLVATVMLFVGLCLCCFVDACMIMTWVCVITILYMCVHFKLNYTLWSSMLLFICLQRNCDKSISQWLSYGCWVSIGLCIHNYVYTVKACHLLVCGCVSVRTFVSGKLAHFILISTRHKAQAHQSR